MLLKDLKCVNSEVNEEKIRKSLKTRENDIILNFQKIFKKGSDILKIENMYLKTMKKIKLKN